MLDRFKLFSALKKIEKNLFFDSSDETFMAQETWRIIGDDADFKKQVEKDSTTNPLWQDSLADTKQIEESKEDYQLLAVDGSQIYPDRHEGTSCSLINIGGIWFYYHAQSQVEVFSEPSVYCAQYRASHEISTDSIDAHRHELELKIALSKALLYKEKTGMSPMVLFDGSLIFWHLIDKPRLKQYYFKRYCAILRQFEQEKILMASHISFPKSKELVNLVRLALKNAGKDSELLHIVDTDIVKELSLYERTTVFDTRVSIVAEYPESLKPSFFYCNVGPEVARIELPRWIASDKELLSFIENIIIDQCKKGDGYPVSLAEAHEQAVVKSSDRICFYKLISQLSCQNIKYLSLSRKNMKKKVMRI